MGRFIWNQSILVTGLLDPSDMGLDPCSPIPDCDELIQCSNLPYLHLWHMCNATCLFMFLTQRSPDLSSPWVWLRWQEHVHQNFKGSESLTAATGLQCPLKPPPPQRCPGHSKSLTKAQKQAFSQSAWGQLLAYSITTFFPPINSSPCKCLLHRLHPILESEEVVPC